MTTRLPALCWACERRTEGERARCEAFPDGIPFEIIGLAGDHREAVDGDHGLRFVQADTDAARAAFADWEAFHNARSGTEVQASAEDIPDESRSAETDVLDLIIRTAAAENLTQEDLDFLYEAMRGVDSSLVEADYDGLYEAMRAAGQDVTPGQDRLHHYWTVGKGRRLWNTWRELVAHLVKYVSLRKAKIFASRWFIETHGYAAGSDKNRVAHGKPPRGHRVGPG